MRFINKSSKIVKSTCFLLAVTLVTSLLVGCGAKKELNDAYDMNMVVSSGNASKVTSESNTQFVSQSLCVATNEDILLDSVSNTNVVAAGAFNDTTKETLYSYHVFDKNYPASTTKILTAYLTLKYGKLDDVVTVSEAAVDLPSGASNCALKAGDKVTVEDLLYGLIIVSGNDAANALAEYVSGSVEEFAKLMNEESRKLYATHSNFVNANGIHDENHYTTVYDLYLIFHECVKNKTFLNLIHTISKDIVIERANGEKETVELTTTNKFLTKKAQYPAEYTMIGGKTGTTTEAGKCLVLLTKNDKGEDVIFIALGASSKDQLYLFLDNLMNACIE